MIWWMVDNVILVLLIMGLVAACFGAVWWNYRDNRLLLGVAVPLALGLLAWVLSLVIVTDRKQLALNVESMRDLINAGKIDEFTEFFDEDITIDTMNGKMPFKRAQLKALAEGNKKTYTVKRIFVTQIDVEEVDRPKAEVSFVIGNEEGPERGRCRMAWIYGADGKWRVKMLTVEHLIGGQKAPVLLPF